MHGGNQFLIFACFAFTATSIQKVQVVPPAVEDNVKYALVPVTSVGVDIFNLAWEHRDVARGKAAHHALVQISHDSADDTQGVQHTNEGSELVQSANESMASAVQKKSETRKDDELITQIMFDILRVMILFIFAVMYKSKVVDLIQPLHQIEPNSRGKDFKAGLCECWSSLNLCLHTSCCGACRAAHNYHVTNLMGYWSSIVLMSCCACFMPCIGGLYLRPALRKDALGLEPDCLMDFLKWCFCSPCAIGQEAMDIDELSGVYVRCCCELEVVERPADLGASPHQPLLSAQEQETFGNDTSGQVEAMEVAPETRASRGSLLPSTALSPAPNNTETPAEIPAAATGDATNEGADQATTVEPQAAAENNGDAARSSTATNSTVEPQSTTVEPQAAAENNGDPARSSTATNSTVEPQSTTVEPQVAAENN